MIVLILLVWAGLSLAMAGAWATQRATRNAGWVDVTWTFALGAAGVALALAPPGPPDARRWLVAGLAALWSIRLGLHIAARTRGGHEDSRYAAFRIEWGAAFEWRMFWFLQIQAVAAMLLSLSFVAAARNPAGGLRPTDLVGVVLVLGAIVGEGIADRQLQRFRNDPANRSRVCDAGLWGLSRHPNYFFEWLGWVGYPVIAIAGLWPWGIAALAGPALMYWLLVHVSGIPPLEAQMLKSRGQAFKDYQARVRPFLPWPR